MSDILRHRLTPYRHTWTVSALLGIGAFTVAIGLIVFLVPAVTATFLAFREAGHGNAGSVIFWAGVIAALTTASPLLLSGIAILSFAQIVDALAKIAHYHEQMAEMQARIRTDAATGAAAGPFEARLAAPARPL